MQIKPQTLAEYHFDKEKSGNTLRKWADECGLTRQELADLVGMSVHTLNNSLYGKVQDLTIDRTFKITTATGHSVCEYISIMLEGENIDFADKVHVLRDGALHPVRYPAAHPAHPAKDAEPVSDALLDRIKAIYEGSMEQLRDQIKQLKESREIMREQYQQQIVAMEHQHTQHTTVMENRHQETLTRVDREMARLQKQNSRLRNALIIETSAIGLLFFFDALIGDRGWILRSWFGMGGSNYTSIMKG